MISRNLELLTERELDSAESHPPPAPSSKPEPLPHFNNDDVVQEEMLRLVQRLFSSSRSDAPRKVIFCGVDRENESSLVCASAGRALATVTSRPACLIDANIHQQILSGLVKSGIPGTQSGKVPSGPQFSTRIRNNLWLAGTDLVTDEGHALLPLNDLKSRIAQLEEQYEYLLIDVPGTSVCGDAYLFGQIADAAVLVVRANSTRRLSARKSKEGLEAVGLRVVGTVLSDRTFPIPESIYSRL